MAMDKRMAIDIAQIAIDKKMTKDQLRYSDYMYGMEFATDVVWEYVEECEKIGTDAFRWKYGIMT